MQSKSKAGLILLAIAHLTCNQAILTAPSGTDMTVIVNPPSIKANGGVAVVTVVLIEGGGPAPTPSGSPGTGTGTGANKSTALATGNPVADGTVVQFFTTLGIIDEQAKTNDGVARANLRSDARSGTAHITVISGPTSDSSGRVDIGNTRAKAMFVTANPTRLIQQRASRIVATVIDENGNPVEDVGVIFTVATVSQTVPSPAPSPVPSPLPTEIMESRGTPVFTDNNGQAIDVMRTDHPTDAPTRVVKITARALIDSDVSGSVDVTIN